MTQRELVLFRLDELGISDVYKRQGFWRFAEVNWFLSGFNLLPLPGLDGGSILSLVLCTLFGERGERAAGAVGLFVSGLLAAALLLLCFTRAAI